MENKIKRSFGEIRAAGDDRTMRFVFSTGAKDRHGTRISPKAWRLDSFNKNGIASYQHRAYGDPDPDKIIGPARAWVEKDRLIGDIQFETEDVNPLAEKLYRKVKAGTLNAVSVGFLEHSGHWGKKDLEEEEETYYFDDVELLEISLVSVPSNAEALAMREFEPMNDGEFVEAARKLLEKRYTSDTTGDVKFKINGDELVGVFLKPDISNIRETLTDREVTNSNKMEKEREKDLAPETKVDVNVKVDASELKETLSEFTKSLEGVFIPGAPAPAISKEERKAADQYMISKAIFKMAKSKAGDGRFDGLEREMHQEAEKQAIESGTEIFGLGVPDFMINKRATLEATTDAAGGYTVATDLPGFIDTLKNAMVLLKAGATFMDGLKGDVSIPKASANSTSIWVAEGHPSTQSDPTFTAVTMSPKRLTTHTEYTYQLLKQSTIDVERFVRENLFYSVANALETTAFRSAQTSNAPTSLYASSINDADHGSNGTILSWANMVIMEQMVAVDNALKGRLAYITNAEAAGLMKQTLKSTYQGGFIWEIANALAGQGTINGYPAYVSNCVPANIARGSHASCSSVFFGDWTELIFGRWGGGLDLIVNPYSKDTSGTVRVVISGYYDLAVKHAEAFSVIRGLETA